MSERERMVKGSYRPSRGTHERRRGVMITGAVGLAALIAIAGAPGHASAQSASVQAQSLFDEGRQLLTAGKIAEACAAFEASQKLDPAITTQLNLANCREQNNQLATAWGAFVEANRMARVAHDDKYARIASTRSHKLEPRLSKLTISVPASSQVPGLEVLRGTDPVNQVAWNHALPIDGGTYTITARASGRATWKTTRTIKTEADLVTIEIPKLADAKPSDAIAAKSPDPATPDPSVAPRPVAPGSSMSPRSSTIQTSVVDTAPSAPGNVASAPPSRRSLLLPVTVGAGAIVLGGVAVGFLLAGNSAYDRAKKSMVQAERDSLSHKADTRRYFAEGFGVAALACAGGAAFLLWRREQDPGPSQTAALTPVASPQLTGVAVVGRW